MRPGRTVGAWRYRLLRTASREGADVIGGSSRPLLHAAAPALDATAAATDFGYWRAEFRQSVQAEVEHFLRQRCLDELGDAGVDIAADVLLHLVMGGKYVRSTFAYLGWLCGSPPGDAAHTGALRAAASFELLQAFALLQDDVMDDATVRRGRPAAHLQFARWHADRAMSGPSRRFGEAAAVLLGDLCLVWAEQLLRESGLDDAALRRALPRYDAMRTELAIGQFADLVNDARGLPSLDAVLDVARRKSGNYTVRRPLEIGAAAAGCDDATVTLLGRYGAAVGEAFQLRDDLLGIFGAPAVTGKPVGSDLAEHKATSVVVAAHQLADSRTRRELADLMGAETLGEADLSRWRQLISASGAVQWIEDLIADRVAAAGRDIAGSGIDPWVQAALVDMAAACTARVT
ncbi:polyprenyl synthetase family protein [Mycobacterium sp. MYCO198283]|uniref:polyprenyl synthetase family protein n=1 Tax=Mycobacterium sp. MYCO198283 TaxID=2883505 RepID=UPI0035ABE71B